MAVDQHGCPSLRYAPRWPVTIEVVCDPGFQAEQCIPDSVTKARHLTASVIAPSKAPVLHKEDELGNAARAASSVDAAQIQTYIVTVLRPTAYEVSHCDHIAADCLPLSPQRQLVKY